MEIIKIELQEILDLLPESVSLTYVDYTDNLDHRIDLIQKCIGNGDSCPLDDMIEDAFWEQRQDNLRRYRKELRKSLMEKYGLDKKQAKYIIRENRDSIDQRLYDLDSDYPLEGLLRNSNLGVMHYDTGYYMEGGSWSWSQAEVRQERMRIKKHLGIFNTSAHDDAIEELIANASGGGDVLVFFNSEKIDDIIVGDLYLLDNINSIEFSSPSIGIINMGEGSGHATDIPIDIRFPFDRRNLFFERSIKYNWTYSIAGMCHDWADRTKVDLLEEKIDGSIETSATNELLKREEIYNRIFKEGKCTFGDMDITRHRNTPYSNNFPCGNKCTECGTFWID